MPSYLLTYNPDSPHWPEQRRNRLRNEIAKASERKPIRWNCAKGVVQGDRGLLLRQGNIRGIFGLATATCDAFPDPDGKKGRYYAHWHLDHIVDPEEASPIISTQDLKRRFPKGVQWHPRRSGNKVLEAVAGKLIREIQAGRE